MKLPGYGQDFVIIFYLRFIYLFERQTYREGEAEREREIDLPSTGSLPKWPQRPELRRSEARSQELLPGLPCGCRGPRVGPSSIAFPGHSRELDQKWSSWVSNQRPYGMLALQARALTRCTTMPVPADMFLLTESN